MAPRLKFFDHWPTDFALSNCNLINCITQTLNIPGQLEWWDCSRIEFCPGVTVEWNKFLTGDIYRRCVFEFARNPLSRVAALGMLRLFFEQVFLWRLEGRVSPDVGPHLEAESCRHFRFGRTHDGRHFVFRKHGVSEMTERNEWLVMDDDQTWFYSRPLNNLRHKCFITKEKQREIWHIIETLFCHQTKCYLVTNQVKNQVWW